MFDGRVALVSGGASGIGLATVALLHRLGARIIIADVDDAAGAAAAGAHAGSFIHCDVASSGQWQALGARVRSEHGRLDIAVLNAGVRSPATELDDLDDGVVSSVLEVNLGGILRGIRTCSQLMGPGASVVVTASVAAFHPVEVDPIYAMTKHAVVGLCRSLAPQLTRRGITLNLTCPSFVDTPLLRSNLAVMARLERDQVALLDPAVVALAAVSLIASGGTGQAVVCHHGQVPLPWSFRDP